MTKLSYTHVNYDQLASTYDQRYAANPFVGITATLLSLARDCGNGCILEVGCGTGRWLADLQPVVRWVYGLDLSLGMLRLARQRQGPIYVTCGHASQLPFPDAMFDLIFCVNAFHHFDRPRAFIADARRLLRPGGALAIIGMDPHRRRDQWYLYHYFPGTYETDLQRFPAGGTVVDWMIAAGFERIGWGIAERIVHQLVGRDVFTDPILQKHGTSQLALLTDDAYEAGMQRIQTAVVEAEATGDRLVFPVDISLTLVSGWI